VKQNDMLFIPNVGKNSSTKSKQMMSLLKKWGDLGPVYGKQWRSWEYQYGDEYSGGHHLPTLKKQIDQISKPNQRP
jgi:thymidylate synthase